MKCPYCKGEDNFDNSNLSHKYKHDCNNYFKKCPICKTIYATENNYNLENCIVVNNIFDIDFCTQCNRAWLPDFPTSWTRSLTNLNKIYEIIEDIHNNQQREINSENLYTIQRSHYGVIFNPERANLRGVETYIESAGERRMSEYFLAFKNMGFLKVKDYTDTGKANYEFTEFGAEIATSSDPKDILSYFILGYINIKINNGYQQKRNNSCYQYFKIRFIHNILKMINYIERKDNNGASKYQIGLSCLVRNRKQFKNYALEHVDRLSSENIKNQFFRNEDELVRAIVSTFLNIFESMNIIKSNDDLYFLSNLGKNILFFLNQNPAIWYEDILNLSSENSNDPNKTFAELILWRLLNQDYINENDINIEMSSVTKNIETLTNKKINNINDIQLNLYYDEPLYNKSHNNTKEILDYITSFISEEANITRQDIKNLTQLLHFSWFGDIKEMINEEIIDHFIHSNADNLFKTKMQTGQKWHNKSKKLLNDLGLNAIDYKEEKIFEDILIDGLKLKLPGGTVYNPDILILEEGYGKESCILVDAKDENSIDGEIPKLMGYNEYASDERVNSYTIITLRGNLSPTTKQKIENNIQEFSKITIIEEKALETLTNKNLSKEEILDFIIPTSGFKHITQQNCSTLN